MVLKSLMLDKTVDGSEKMNVRLNS
jgi:hypothetical protein